MLADTVWPATASPLAPFTVTVNSLHVPAAAVSDVGVIVMENGSVGAARAVPTNGTARARIVNNAVSSAADFPLNLLLPTSKPHLLGELGATGTCSVLLN